MTSVNLFSSRNRRNLDQSLQHEGYQDYDSRSDYGNGLDSAAIAANLKKLGVDDISEYAHRDIGKGGAGSSLFDRTSGGSLQNYYGSLTGQEPGAPQEPKGGSLGNLFQNFSKFQGMGASKEQPGANDAALRSAYDKILQQNLYKELDYTPEEFKANAEAHGGYEGTKDWNKWVYRENQLTGEKDWVLARDRKDENNLYRQYKDPLIKAGGGILGGIVGSIVPGVGTVYGAAAGAALAGNLRDAYKGAVMRRKVKQAQEKWERGMRQDEEHRLELERAKMGHVYVGAGEGVVDFDTKDKTNLKNNAYVRS